MYIVGSALSQRTIVYKGEKDWFEQGREIEKEAHRIVIEEFGEERAGANVSFRDPFTPEKQAMINRYSEECSRMRNGLYDRPIYDDIDIVLVGLSQQKANPKKRIWKKFSQVLKVNFPNAKHPHLEYGGVDALARTNGFGNWDIYCDVKNYVVSDYQLEILSSGEYPTKIHFMLFNGDERYGSAERNKRGEDDEDFWLDHWPNKDVNLEMWRKLQASDKLPFLPVVEFSGQVLAPQLEKKEK